jgi:hypothetical protein
MLNTLNLPDLCGILHAQSAPCQKPTASNPGHLQSKIFNLINFGTIQF